MADIVVLLSVGRHPVSGRARAADLDARALGLALSLSEQGAAKVTGLHAGPDVPVLGDYLGMGLSRLVRLDIGTSDDAFEPLAAWLTASPPSALLAGTHAEQGAASGFLPYTLAKALNAPLIAQAAAISLADGGIEVLQARPGGRRHRLGAAFPVVVTVGSAAPEPRQSAVGRARRGSIETVATRASASPVAWAERPQKPLAKMVAPVARGSAAERLRAATQGPVGRGAVMIGPSPDDAARAILAYLREEGIIARNGNNAA